MPQTFQWFHGDDPCAATAKNKLVSKSPNSVDNHENIMETSWKHHGNIMKTSWKHHENILQLKIPNLCLGSKICVGRVRMRVCEVPQNDMHYRMMVELMNWYVMVSCHVMLQKTPALVFPSTFPAPIRCRCDGATFSFCEPCHSGIRRDLMGYDGMVIGC